MGFGEYVEYEDSQSHQSTDNPRHGDGQHQQQLGDGPSGDPGEAL
jgi:hypothetical protein